MNTTKARICLTEEKSKMIEPNAYYTFTKGIGKKSECFVDVVCYYRRKIGNGMVILYLRYPTRSIPELDLIAMNKRIHNEQHT